MLSWPEEEGVPLFPPNEEEGVPFSWDTQKASSRGTPSSSAEGTWDQYRKHYRPHPSDAGSNKDNVVQKTMSLYPHCNWRCQKQ